jgi:hypothetical protein
MKNCVAGLAVAFAMLGLALAQENPPAGWAYSRQTDALRGTAFDQFMIQGEYIDSPSLAGKVPRMVVQCSDGRFKEGFLDVGAVVQSGESSEGVTRSLKGRTQAFVYMRSENREKPVKMLWEISNDGQALFFSKMYMGLILTGRKIGGRASNTDSLVHEQIFGVTEAFGNQVTMRFNMPTDSTRLVESCGLR